jgi:hypothetical protein
MKRAIGLLLLPMLAGAGCAGDRMARCEDDARYRDAPIAAPIRVPDDLSIPDESQAIRVPPPSVSGVPEREPGRCLESPPDFFDRQQLGG